MSLAPGDYTAINGSFHITDSNTEQCVNISVLSDNDVEGDECLNYTISTDSTVPGLSLSPDTATICISDPQKGTS